VVATAGVSRMHTEFTKAAAAATRRRAAISIVYCLPVL
jgi:hypothetical protein